MQSSAEATASWAKRPISLNFFLGIQSSYLKPLTSPAMRVENWAASKSVMGATPDSPARRLFQVSSVPSPLGVTRPIPVMTTRSIYCSCDRRRATLAPRSAAAARGRARARPPTWLLLGVRLDVVDRVLDAADLLRVLVRDVDLERLLEGEDQLHQAQRIGAEIVDERRLRLDVLLVDVEL